MINRNSLWGRENPNHPTKTYYRLCILLKDTFDQQCKGIAFKIDRIRDLHIVFLDAFMSTDTPPPQSLNSYLASAR